MVPTLLWGQTLPSYQYKLTPSPVLDIGRLAKEPKLEGYVGARMSRTGDSTGFSIQRARLTFHARPVPFAAVRVQTDLSAVGKVNADSIPATVLIDAYAQLTPPDTTGVIRLFKPSLIFGQFRTPFSLEFLSAFTYLQTANRSRVVDRLSTRRDIGILGNVQLGKYGIFAASVVNGGGPNRPSNADKKEMTVFRLTLLPLQNLAIAGKRLNHGLDHRWGYDARWLAGEIVIEGEVINQQIGGTGTPVDGGGGYVLASYRLRPWIQPVIKWEQLHTAQGAGLARAETMLTWVTYGINLLSVDDRERFRVQLNWIEKHERPHAIPGEFIIQLITIF
jgi:hypothetical protein